jgi:hypothetical protein
MIGHSGKGVFLLSDKIKQRKMYSVKNQHKLKDDPMEFATKKFLKKPEERKHEDEHMLIDDSKTSR